MSDSMIPDISIQLIRLRNDMIRELKPPWWEPRLLFGSFLLGIAVGIVLGKVFL
jgi:hypothetical protein